MASIKAARFNGFGVWFLGIQNTEERGLVSATFWITLLFLPLIPLTRAKIHFTDVKRYTVLETQPLKLNEVLSTYLYGWILLPLLILGPVALGLALTLNDILPGLNVLLFFAGAIWACFATWQLASWDQYRRLTKQRSLLFPKRP